jgi:hypothetical protein
VGGGLAAIMSAAITFRDNTKTKNFRALLDAHDAVITENDPNAFVEAGTKVRTVSVTLTKKKI